jgi:hypothetical protein
VSPRGHILSAGPFASGCAPSGATHFLNFNIVKNIECSTYIGIKLYIVDLDD